MSLPAIVVYVDGLYEPVHLGGTAAFGYVVIREGVVRKHGIAGHGPEMSNNSQSNMDDPRSSRLTCVSRLRG